MKTRAAQAAQLIRKELKTALPGLEFTCKSQTYSMGSSITVGMIDQTHEIKEQVEKITAKYIYGSFDGMTDCYNMTNSRDDIPQVKYLFVENDMSDDTRQGIYSLFRKSWVGGDTLPEKYDGNAYLDGKYISEWIWSIFSGRIAL